MNKRSALALLAMLATASVATAADTRPDGTIVAREQCAAEPSITYEKYLEEQTKSDAAEVAAAKSEGHVFVPSPGSYLTRDQFIAHGKENATIGCERLRYLSDGLQVVAYLWKPKNIGASKLPLIIFNRGGNREFGKLLPTPNFRRLTLDGFVVLASQYRGNDGGEGKEEFGGADVHDIRNLLPLAASLGYVDMDNTFLLGWSRGGMMTALALKEGMKVNAAAMGGPLTNLITELARRPQLGTRVWSELIPGYNEHRDEVLRDRSPVFWADRLHTPLLIMHGGADWRADPADTLEFAQALQRAGVTYQLIIYAGDEHGLRINKDDSNRHRGVVSLAHESETVESPRL